MTAMDLLASSLNRRDDIPNQDLAVEIIKSKRYDWVEELVNNLQHKDKNIQSDCIKTLYEIGERGAAEMIAPYCEIFGNLIQSKNNRMVWGAMYALASIAAVKPKDVFELLPIILQTIEKGSVITIDCGVVILANLSANPEYTDTTFPLLMEQLGKCPFKQLPMYAERTLIAVNPANQQQFIDLLEARLPEMEKDSQKQRINKVLKKIKK